MSDNYYFCLYYPEACLEYDKCLEGHIGIICMQCDIKKGYYK